MNLAELELNALSLQDEAEKPKGMRTLPPDITDEIIPEIRRRLANDQECIVIFNGGKGLGKSTSALAIQLEFDPSFNIKTQMSYTFDEIAEHRATIPPGKGHHIDEIRFTRMAFRTREGDLLNLLARESRVFNHFETVCTPDIHDSLPVFLRHANYYFQFFDIGYCVLLERNNYIVSGNPFGLNMQDLRKIVDEKTFKKYFVKAAEKSGTLVNVFEFPKYTPTLTPQRFEQYRDYRVEHTRTLYQSAEVKKTTAQELKAVRNSYIAAFVRSCPHLTIEEIAQALPPDNGTKLSVPTLKVILKKEGITRQRGRPKKV